jgi:ferredoxin-NADP reductase
VGEARAEVVAVEHGTPDSVTLTLRPNSAWRGFRAGQFVEVTVEIDGVQRRRCYSPACSEHCRDGRIELTLRAHPEGEVSRHLNDHAVPGMVLALKQAAGDFALPQRRPERLLLISGGSGITPVMAMLRTLCDEGHGGRVTFLHYARGERDLIYRDELERLEARHPNVQVKRVFTREGGGHFQRTHLLAADPYFDRSETFVCGPPALIDSVRELWAEEALDARLHVEHFVPPAPAVVLGEAEGTVAFSRSEVEAENSGAPLLDQAEQAGLSPAHGCRMGICHSCTCRKLAGGVRNVRTGEVSTAPDEDIQICISVPVGDVQLDI